MIQRYEHTIQKNRQIQSLDDVKKFSDELQSSFTCETKLRTPLHQTSTSSLNEKRFPVDKAWDSKKLKVCKFCNKQGHILLVDCYTFKQLSTEEKKKALIKTNTCQNCMMHDSATKCHRTIVCETCKGRHNTFLHKPK